MVVETCSSLSCPERGGTAVSVQLGPWGLHKQRLFVRKAWPRWLEKMNAEFAALLPEQHLCVCVCVQAAFCHPCGACMQPLAPPGCSGPVPCGQQSHMRVLVLLPLS